MLPLGEKPLSIFLLGPVTCEYTLLCHFLPILWAYNGQCGWRCFWPQHNHGMLPVSPSAFHTSFFTRPPAQIRWSEIPGL